MSEFKLAVTERGWCVIHGVTDETEFLRLAQQFGPLRPQYDGEIIWSIAPDPQFDGVYHSLNTEPLTPHTELYEMPGVPNRYQALWCVRPATCGGGQTTMADGWGFVRSLSPEEREHLLRHQCQFHSSPGINQSGLGSSASHPMLEVAVDGHLIFRFSSRCMELDDDPVVQSVVQRCVQFFQDNQAQFSLATGDVLVWDNHRCMHSRTGFHDRSRLLRRLFIN